QRPQEVALVLLEVPAAMEDEPAGPAVSRDAGVVPGGHGVRLPRQGTLEERAELHLTVADDAGAGRPAGPILPREVGDDQLRELALVVQEVVGNPELPGDRPRAVGRGGGAAGAEARGLAVGLGPGGRAERDPDHAVAGLGEERCRHGAVDAAAHPND